MDTFDLKTYQAIFDTIPIGLGIASITGKLLIFNQAILVPGGYSKEDINAMQSVAELYFDPSDREKVLGIAKKDGKLSNYRVRFKKKNGDPYFTLLSLIPVQFQGQPGWLASVLDIDEQVKAEEKVKQDLVEIEKLNEVMVNRELKMIELKQQIEKKQPAETTTNQ